MSKQKKHIILKLTNQDIFYNEQSFVKWGQTNFSDKQHFKLNEHRNVFWGVEMIAYDKNEKALLLGMTDSESMDICRSQRGVGQLDSTSR